MGWGGYKPPWILFDLGLKRREMKPLLSERIKYHRQGLYNKYTSHKFNFLFPPCYPPRHQIRTNSFPLNGLYVFPLLLISNKCASHSRRETANKNKQFKEIKTLISNLHFIRHRFQGYRCKSAIAIFAWRLEGHLKSFKFW